jgi:hypothetical protein
VNLESALRFVEYEAQQCRERIPYDRDAHEMFCLLLPGLLRAFNLEPMDGWEAEAFRRKFKETLNQKNCARGHSLALTKK